jgi:hypothetical protein
MQAEFEEAEANGQPLRFAFGCLLAAWRTMPDHAEGRYKLASHALAVLVLVPMGTLLATAALSGFPIVEASDGAAGFLRGSGTFRSLLDPGTQCLGPAMLLLVLLLAGCHALMAWWLLERNWRRIGTATCFCAAVMVSLVILMACAALHLAALAQPLAGWRWNAGHWRRWHHGMARVWRRSEQRSGNRSVMRRSHPKGWHAEEGVTKATPKHWNRFALTLARPAADRRWRCGAGAASARPSQIWRWMCACHQSRAWCWRARCICPPDRCVGPCRSPCSSRAMGAMAGAASRC